MEHNQDDASRHLQMEQKEQMEQHLTGSVSAPVGFMMMALSSSITGCACAHAAIESDRFTHRI